MYDRSKDRIKLISILDSVESVVTHLSFNTKASHKVHISCKFDTPKSASDTHKEKNYVHNPFNIST